MGLTATALSYNAEAYTNQTCKKTIFLNKLGLSQKHFTRKSAQITTNLTRDKTA